MGGRRGREGGGGGRRGREEGEGGGKGGGGGRRGGRGRKEREVERSEADSHVECRMEEWISRC